MLWPAQETGRAPWAQPLRWTCCSVDAACSDHRPCRPLAAGAAGSTRSSDRCLAWAMHSCRPDQRRTSLLPQSLYTFGPWRQEQGSWSWSYLSLFLYPSFWKGSVWGPCGPTSDDVQPISQAAPNAANPLPARTSAVARAETEMKMPQWNYPDGIATCYNPCWPKFDSGRMPLILNASHMPETDSTAPLQQIKQK